MADGRALIELRSITKRYPGVVALDDVNLEVGHGEVLGLIGENGAGKSTLMKILGGVAAPTSGAICIDGIQRTALTVKEAAGAGIAFVHQELNVFENLDVAANIFIGQEPGRGGILRFTNKAASHRRAIPFLERLGAEFSPDTLVADLSIAQRQTVEIAKALAQNARVIIMDEPTSSLTLSETALLLDAVASLRREGVSVIYISHRLGEIKACADRVVVLRDGNVVGALPRERINHETMIRLMIGRDLKALYMAPTSSAGEDVVTVDNLVTSAFPNASTSLSIRRGEIVGLSGLVGAGRTSLAETLFGIHAKRAGQVRLCGEVVDIASPRDAIRLGLFLVPEDRKRSGLVLDFTVKDNITLANLNVFTRFLLLQAGRERRFANEQIQRLGIKTPSADSVAATLSGGNQQKIVLARWLGMQPKAIVFDEPTRGIDVGAKTEIYALMRELADAGVAILMISSDMEEVIGVSDRIIVMHEGRISGELGRQDFSESNVLTLAIGGAPNMQTELILC